MRHSSEPLTFQTVQVVSDLCSVAAIGFSTLSELLKPIHKPALRRVIFDQKCILQKRDLEALHGDLLLLAALPDKKFEGFLYATAILLADRLQCGAGTDDLYWNWDTFSTQYSAAPSPIRAALMNGFRWAHVTRCVNLETVPQGRDLTTFDEDDLIRILKGVARSMTEDERDLVVALAADDTHVVHKTALDNCLKGSCILSEFGGWFPGEVVEKASLDSTHSAYASCTALVLLDAVTTRDSKGKMAFRWEEHAERYLRLPKSVRLPLAAGIRHLFEMPGDWGPYSGWSADQLAEKAVVVPFAKP